MVIIVRYNSPVQVEVDAQHDGLEIDGEAQYLGSLHQRCNEGDTGFVYLSIDADDHVEDVTKHEVVVK